MIPISVWTFAFGIDPIIPVLELHLDESRLLEPSTNVFYPLRLVVYRRDHVEGAKNLHLLQFFVRVV